MGLKYLSMDDGLYRYLCRARSNAADPILKPLRAETERLGEISRMQISEEQGAFMQLLVSAIGAKNIIEVGTFTGYSSLCMARGLPEDGRLICVDASKEWTDIARKYWKKAGVDGRIELRLGPAAETLEQLLKAGEASKFDLMFIDADKASYDIYYEGGLKLLRPGGVMLIHNVLWSGSVADPSVKDEDTSALRALNKKIMADTRVDLVMVPICDGVTMARKK